MKHLPEYNRGRAVGMSRHGFTLLELLLATVLATVLMVGVMAIVTDLGVSRSHARNPASGPNASRPAAEIDQLDAWARLLCEDIRHADDIDTSDKDLLAFTGYNALDPSCRRRSHRPVRVTYEFRDIDSRKWIVRRQTALDLLTNRNVQRDLVCCGVSRFELTPIPAAEKRPADNTPKAKDGGKASKPSVAPKEQNVAKGAEHADRQKASSIVRSKDGRISILVEGQYYYPRYAPEWARKKYAKELARLNGIAGVPSVFNKGRNTEPEAQETDQDDNTPALGTSWRLRIWADDVKNPAYDRILSIPWGRSK